MECPRWRRRRTWRGTIELIAEGMGETTLSTVDRRVQHAPLQIVQKGARNHHLSREPPSARPVWRNGSRGSQ